jgi:hypothetical protein
MFLYCGPRRLVVSLSREKNKGVVDWVVTRRHEVSTRDLQVELGSMWVRYEVGEDLTSVIHDASAYEDGVGHQREHVSMSVDAILHLSKDTGEVMLPFTGP